MWDVAKGQCIYRIKHGSSAEFDSNGRLAISSVKNKKPWIWVVDVEKAKVLHSFPVGDGKSSQISYVEWGLNDTLFTWMSGGRSYLPLRRWSIDGRMLNDLGPCSELKVSADHRWAAFDGSKGVRLVDLKNFSKVRVWEKSRLINLGFAKEYLYFSRDKEIIRVNLATLQETSWSNGCGGWVLPSGLLTDVVVDVRAEKKGVQPFMEFYRFGESKPLQKLKTVLGIGSGDGHWFANGSGVWDLKSGKLVAAFKKSDTIRWRMAFSNDSRMLAYTEGKSVFLLDLEKATRKKL